MQGRRRKLRRKHKRWRKGKRKRKASGSDNTTLPASRASGKVDAPTGAAAAATAAALDVVSAAALSPKLQAPLPPASKCAPSASKRAKK